MSLLSRVLKEAAAPPEETNWHVAEVEPDGRDWPEPPASMTPAGVDEDGLRWYLVERTLKDGATVWALTREDGLRLAVAWNDYA